MDIIKDMIPWEHYYIDNFLTQEHVERLYRLCDGSDTIKNNIDNGMFLNSVGQYQNTAPVHAPLPDDISDIVQTQLDEISQTLGMASSNFVWGYSMNATYPKLDVQLMPHNDDFAELGKYGAGKIKVLVYLGRNDISYKNWGTKLYTSTLVEDFAKEVKFVPGRAFIFKPVANTYHGTQFNKELQGPRYMLGAEYMEKKNG
tara:strand:+ start:86 stop:688 length:603 start_codon:yes stop_codon:yes gene_type:complete